LRTVNLFNAKKGKENCPTSSAGVGITASIETPEEPIKIWRRLFFTEI
jgi:hypothetical protein